MLLEDRRGLDGDLYELVIPDRYAGRAERQPWRGGKLHALRPVFLELGVPAALIYEVLEHAREPLSSVELAGRARLSPATVYTTIKTLAAHHLARCSGGRWVIVAATSLAALARQFGIGDTLHRLVQRHRDERASYRPSAANRHPCAADRPGHPGLDPTPCAASARRSGQSALELLQKVLGAYVVLDRVS